MRTVAGLLAVLGCFAAEPADTLEEVLDAKLTERLRQVEAGTNGVVGVHAIDLSTGRTISWRADTVFPQASSIKLPILLEVFRQAAEGKFSLADKLTLAPSEAAGGSGHLRLMLRSGPLSISIAELAAAMMETSDNTAANRLIALVSMEAINANLNRLGFRETRLRRRMMDGAAAARGDENVSTPREMARLAQLIHANGAQAAGGREIHRILERVEGDFRKAVPAEVKVLAKPGELTGVRCETGIIYVKNRPFALSVAGTYLDDGENPVPAIAKAVYEHFAKLGASNQYGNRTGN